jgi:hypothetical protein
MVFAASINLSDLDEATGFRISGAAAGNFSGASVASAGDVNGDGIDDLIIGASLASPNGHYSGASYVVFGSAAGFAADLDLGALDGTKGFRISGAAAEDFSGVSVASAGDVNGDGLADLIIGARGADPNAQSYAGASYVVFGSALGFAADLNLSALDGTNGFRISGLAADDQSGVSVASAGDVNGDGIDDLIIGAKEVQPNSANIFAGTNYVVFGSTLGFAADLDLSALDGTNGFRIRGAATRDYSGYSSASAGDINGDGIDDLIVGAFGADPNGEDRAGASYVVFGKDTATVGSFAADLNLGGLDGTNGFRISGAETYDRSGHAVASAGDVNGDGLGDVIIGAWGVRPNGTSYTGASYVVFGSALGFAANLDLSALDGSNGFRISGEASGDFSGWSVASAGDVNRDGIDDLIIGAMSADPNGVTDSGASYVVFGNAAGFTANLNLSALDGSNGFRINGVAADDWSGYSSASAGDVNGDGVDDLIIGAMTADPNGVTDSGASYVVYGRVDFTGTAADEARIGGVSHDSLAGLDGNDVLSGLAGDDVLDGGAMGDLLFGGAGADDLLGGDGGDVLNGDDGDDALDGGTGHDKLFGGLGADTLVGDVGNDRFDGGLGIDSLTGGGGNDYLDGGEGADVMAGGTENDVYLVDDADDQTVELAGQGYDIVRTALDGWVLGDNLEALELQGSGDLGGTGNGAANNIQGNSGANSLDGGAGNDTLNGNDGDDTIVGGLGGDLMRGGIGADAFVVAHAFAAGLETDQIFDFSAAENDWIDLSAIDAIAGGSDDAFTLVGGFSRTAGEMTLSFAGGITTLKLDQNGDGKADYQLKINGDVTGDSAGWLL